MSTEETNAAATVAEQGAHAAPEATSSHKGATRQKGAPKAKKSATAAKTTAVRKKESKVSKKAAKPGRKAAAQRAESKGAKILALIGQPKGATLAALMKAVQWQAHSLRGFLSTAAKKQRIKIESSKNEAGDRVYKISR